jgi:uncharacterized protein YbjT (DUF2867 family)
VSQYRAIVIGATGAVGSALVKELLSSPRCSLVQVVARRPVHVAGQAATDGKLANRIIDFERLETEVDELAKDSDAAFCTMGVGQPSKVSREELWKVDVEYAFAFARACRHAGVKHFSILGALGANARSRLYYFHVKGTIEERLKTLGFPRLSLFRPGLLKTKSVRYGLPDRFNQTLFPLISWALPRDWHEIAVEDLGRAMRLDAEDPARRDGASILQYSDFMRLIEGR